MGWKLTIILQMVAKIFDLIHKICDISHQIIEKDIFGNLIGNRMNSCSSDCVCE